jgi:hypothetical protein
MKTLTIRKTMPTLLIALGLTCLSLSSAVPAEKSDSNRSIVGLWHTYYLGDLVFESFEQFHSDGQEFEGANVYPGAFCQGTFRQTGHTVQLFHTGWLFDANGALFGTFNETQTITVDAGGQTYHGTWFEKDYDLNGNFLSEESGTITATRLTVNTPP